MARVRKRKERVTKAVEAMAWVGVMPVVEEVVVQKGPAHERGAVHAHAQAREGVCHAAALPRHRHDVVVDAHVTVLDEGPALAKPAAALEPCGLCRDLFRDPHGLPSSSRP